MLIIGASVSGGYLAPSPGEILALKFTEPHQIKQFTQNGTRGSQVLQRVKDVDFIDRSCIIGIDFLFWDSTAIKVNDSLVALKKLIDRSEAQRIPLVLGDIPELFPTRQSNREMLNDALSHAQANHPYCRILPLSDLLLKIVEDEQLIFRGKTLSLGDLLPDGLHLSPVASEFLAEEIENALLDVVRRNQD
ncbi:MAG: SGNH/GDSL hydrolase family protein [Proteobacteria bacterium]|nr:MAG: SGNH/GDSL hydrolase family protein [Pseudomonadota bacterium]